MGVCGAQDDKQNSDAGESERWRRCGGNVRDGGGGGIGADGVLGDGVLRGRSRGRIGVPRGCGGDRVTPGGRNRNRTVDIPDIEEYQERTFRQVVVSGLGGPCEGGERQ